METPRPRGVSNGYEPPRGRDVCPAAAFVCRPSSTGRPGTTLCRLGTAATAGRAQGCRRPPAPRPAAAAARSAARGPWCAARRVEATRRGCRQREASPRPLAGRRAGAEVGAGGRAPGWRRAVRRQGPRAVGAGGGAWGLGLQRQPQCVYLEMRWGGLEWGGGFCLSREALLPRRGRGGGGPGRGQTPANRRRCDDAETDALSLLLSESIISRWRCGYKRFDGASARLRRQDAIPLMPCDPVRSPGV